MRMNRKRVLGAILVAFALIAAACGDDDSGGDTTQAPAATEATAAPTEAPEPTEAPATTEAPASTAAPATTAGPADGPTVSIGSFGFSESEILGEIYLQALEANGYEVEHKAQLGSREAVVNPALRSGEINFVPEYIGTALEVTFGIEPSADADAVLADLNSAWAEEGFSVLAYTPAEDKNGIVVTGDTAASLGLAKISDLVGQEGDLVFGGPPECPERPRCIGGLESVYGLNFGEFKPLDTGGPLTVAALDGGEIDVGLLFSSDGTIGARGWVLLEDDLGLQPAENIAPLVNNELIDAYGDGFVALLNAVSAELSQEELTELNRLVGFDGESASDVAGAWLADNGLL
jgi:osmoprotectant transport system substrate-binding protein